MGAPSWEAVWLEAASRSCGEGDATCHRAAEGSEIMDSVHLGPMKSNQTRGERGLQVQVQRREDEGKVMLGQG